MQTELVDGAREVALGILGASAFTYWIVAALSGIAFGLMNAMLPAQGLSLLFLPFIASGGVAGPYVLGRIGLYLAADYKSNIVLSVTFGMVLVTIVLTLITRIFYAAIAVQKLDLEDRQQEAIVRKFGRGASWPAPRDE
ncbi:MAG: hypothetical protein WC807_13915 [Hyphomicrobium sp.]|jgi:hypothetical protein